MFNNVFDVFHSLITFFILNDLLNHSSSHSFIRPILHSFIHSSIHSFIHSYIHSYIYTVIWSCTYTNFEVTTCNLGQLMLTIFFCGEGVISDDWSCDIISFSLLKVPLQKVFIMNHSAYVSIRGYVCP